MDCLVLALWPDFGEIPHSWLQIPFVVYEIEITDFNKFSLLFSLKQFSNQLKFLAFPEEKYNSQEPQSLFRKLRSYSTILGLMTL